MPYLIQTGVDDSRSVLKEFEPDIIAIDTDIWRAMVFSASRETLGRFTAPLTQQDRDRFPRTLLVGKPARGEMPEILGWINGPWIVSLRVKAIIEELEPALHEFIPIQVLSKETRSPVGTYFLVLIRQTLDAVVVEETDFNQGRGKIGTSGAFAPYGQIVLKADAVQGRHLWRGSPPLDLSYFCSDALHDRLVEKNLEGWDLSRRCEFRN